MTQPNMITTTTDKFTVDASLNYQNFNYVTKTYRRNKIALMPAHDDVVQIIHNDLNTMSQDEKMSIFKQVVTNDILDNILLSYALNNLEFTPVDYMDIDTFASIASSIFARYHPKAGGEYFDDDKWTLYTSENTSKNSYILEKGSCIFENTIPFAYYTYNQTLDFVVNLIKVLNQIANNIYVIEKKIYVKSEHIIIVHIYAVDKKLISSEKFKSQTIGKYD